MISSIFLSEQDMLGIKQHGYDNLDTCWLEGKNNLFSNVKSILMCLKVGEWNSGSWDLHLDKVKCEAS